MRAYGFSYPRPDNEKMRSVLKRNKNSDESAETKSDNPSNGAESLQLDFLGNPAVPFAKAEQSSDLNPRYRNAFLPMGASARYTVALAFTVLALVVLHLVLVIREHNRVDTAPQVFMQTEVGKLIPVQTFKAEPSVPLLEAFLDYCVSNIVSMENGELTKLDRVKGLVSEKAINEIVMPLIRQGPKLKAERVNVSSRINQINTSSQEVFVLNHRFKRAFGVSYGTTVLVTGMGGGRSRDTRWDFEVIFVPRTPTNPWGMFANQLREKNLNDKIETIPPELRRPEDLVATKSK